MPTQFDTLANKFSTTVASTYAPTDGFLVVASVTGITAPTRVTCFVGAGKAEIVKSILAVTSVDTIRKRLYVSGAVEGTSNVALGVGTGVEVRGTAGHYAEHSAAINALESSALDPASIVHTTGAESIAGAKTFTTAIVVTAGSSSTKPLVVKGASGQSANLQEWQDSSGTVLASVDTTGQLVFPGVSSTSKIELYPTYGIGIDLSSTCLYVSGSQGFTFRKNSVSGAVTAYLRNDTGRLGIGVFPSATVHALNTNNASDVVAIVQGAPSQSGSLQEWQSSSGTVLHKVGPDGRTYWGNNDLGGTYNVFAGGSRNLAVFQWQAATDGGSIVTAIGGNAVTGSLCGFLAGANVSDRFYTRIQNSGGDAVMEAIALAGGSAYSSYNNNAGVAWVAGYHQTDNHCYKISAYSYPGYNNVLKITPLGATSLSSLDAGAVPLTVQSYTGATANVQEWKDASGTALAAVGATGSVGIGTASPGAKLDVIDSASTNLQVRIRNNKSQSISNTAELVFAARSGGSLFDRAKIVTIASNMGNFGTTMDFQTIDPGTGVFTSRLFVQSNGNIGINNTSPGALLHAACQTSSTKGLVIQGASGQTERLTEWQDSGGSTMACVLSTGQWYSPSDGVGAQYGRYEINGPTNAGMISTIGNDFYCYAPGSHTLNLETGGGNIVLGAFSNPKTIIYGKAAFGSSTANAQIHVTPSGSSVVGAIVQGAASQTADLTQWQNSSGTVLAGVSAAGVVYSGTYSGDSGVGVECGTSNAAIQAKGTGNPQLRANSTSGAVAKVQAVGNSFGLAGTETNHPFKLYVNQNPYLYVDTTGYVGIGNFAATAQLETRASSASTKALVVRGATSQTADLQQWQDSSGTALTSVDPTGALKLVAIADASAPNGSLFRGSDHSSKLCFKDDSGTVHELY